MTTPLTFNIIYTPGTVIFLLPFVQSLLDHSDAKFRLVSNGCMLPEKQMLQGCVAAHGKRLEYWDMPSTECRPHGEVLDMLFAIDTPGPFCFLDSDIIVSGPFLEALSDGARDVPAAYSGAPVWMRDDDGVFAAGFTSLTGEYIWDEAGICLGCTYVAVYDVEIVQTVFSKYQIGFGGYQWKDLSATVRAELVRRSRVAKTYDTAKLVNSLLPQAGRYVPLDHLHHMGGFSFPALRVSTERRGLTGKLKHMLAPLRHARALFGYRRFGKFAEAWVQYRRRVFYRNPVRDYFHGLLRALLSQSTHPRPPNTGSATVNDAVRRTAEAIQHCYAMAELTPTIHPEPTE